MSTPIRNAAPFANLTGAQDRSRRTPVYDPEMFPTHCPHSYTFAERGPLTPMPVSGDGLTSMFGSKTLDYQGIYATHQTPFIQLFNAEANLQYVQRLVPSDAPAPSSFALYMDMVEDRLPVYERGTDGKYKLDANNQKIPTGEYVLGYKGRLVLGPHLGGVLGQASQQVGGLASSTGVQSTMYPLWEIEVADQGAYGDNIGVRLFAPTDSSALPIDQDVVDENLAYLYRLVAVERATKTSTPLPIEGNNGLPYIDFSFKERVVSSRTSAKYYIGNRLVESYREVEDSGILRKQGPFGAQHIYKANLETVLKMIFTNEKDYGLVDGEVDEAFHLINFLSATDTKGRPYFTLQLLGPLEDGLLFSENTTHYMVGGGDGSLTPEMFDSLVKEQLDAWGRVPDIDLLDSAVYNQSAIYDSGYSMETKKSLISVIGKRYDIAAIVSSQEADAPMNSAAEDSSATAALSTYAANFPESTLYGTPACRAIVVAGAGYLKTGVWDKMVPMTYEIARMFARYMGASNGIWQNGLAFDLPPNNIVTSMKNTNVVFRGADQRARDWAINMVYAQNYDRRSLHFPGIQTVYEADDSVLNSAGMMWAIVELEKICERVWRDMSGISGLTDDQFIERGNRLINERIDGKFDNRFIFRVTTHLTQADRDRNYSWSTDIEIGGSGMKTVNTVRIVARRRSDMEEQAVV